LQGTVMADNETRKRSKTESNRLKVSTYFFFVYLSVYLFILLFSRDWSFEWRIYFSLLYWDGLRF
jgi:hypothetical protein